jgi:ABC-2 type transport system permease protein
VAVTTTEAPQSGPAPLPPLRAPWRPDSLLTVLRNWRLIWVFVQTERGNKYDGTLLGSMWDFVRPLMQFFVYFVVIGYVLGLRGNVPNFGIYAFAGVTVVQIFSSSMTTATRSLSKHATLLRQVNVPAQMIPIGSVIAATVRQRASFIALVVGAILTGWRPNHLMYVGYALGGFCLLVAFSAGLGMCTAVAAMYLKDTQYAVSTLLMLVRWLCPVFYPWMLVGKLLPEPLLTLYLANPITVALFAFRETFWVPTVGVEAATVKIDPLPTAPLYLSIVIAGITLGVGHWLMRRYQHRVASRVKWT